MEPPQPLAHTAEKCFRYFISSSETPACSADFQEEITDPQHVCATHVAPQHRSEWLDDVSWISLVSHYHADASRRASSALLCLSPCISLLHSESLLRLWAPGCRSDSGFGTELDHGCTSASVRSAHAHRAKVSSVCVCVLVYLSNRGHTHCCTFTNRGP